MLHGWSYDETHLHRLITPRLPNEVVVASVRARLPEAGGVWVCMVFPVPTTRSVILVHRWRTQRRWTCSRGWRPWPISSCAVRRTGSPLREPGGVRRAGRPVWRRSTERHAAARLLGPRSREDRGPPSRVPAHDNGHLRPGSGTSAPTGPSTPNHTHVVSWGDDGDGVAGLSALEGQPQRNYNTMRAQHRLLVKAIRRHGHCVGTPAN
jgi:hypothetical protein